MYVTENFIKIALFELWCTRRKRELQTENILPTVPLRNLLERQSI